jgi:nitroreductase
MTKAAGFVPLAFERLSAAEQSRRAAAFLASMQRRRSVRAFADEPVPLPLIERAIQTAGTAPSGAHQQPWHFVVVRDAAVKRRIRQAAEAEEYANYTRRMPAEWLNALAPLGTDWPKPFLEIAPCLIVVFEQLYGLIETPEGGAQRRKHYYPTESTGIAVGLLIATLHQAGLATLTHTPSPMGFLRELLGRPRNERPFVLLPVGYPAADCQVPDLERKPLTEIMSLV